MIVRLTAALVVWLGVAAVGAARPSFAQQNGIAPADREIRAEVQRKLRGLDGASRITVDVQAAVVTLSGMVPTLWAKEQAISRARSAGQIQSLVSELEIRGRRTMPRSRAR
jgi:osmotically-inducible protein OsmY